MKRHFMAVGTSVVLLAFGGTTALANGSHGSAPGNSASQSASNTQLLPISVGAGVALPINANLPVGLLSSGPAQGAVSQQAAAEASGAASNHRVVQTVRQQGAGNTAGQGASNTQVLPIGAGAGAGAPVNGNVPAGVLASGPRQRDVAQQGRAQASGTGANAGTVQSVRQQGGGNSASQSASSTQLLPIALGLGAAAPVNANVPVGLLSAGPRQGEVRQQGAARAIGTALNHELDQAIEQRGDRGEGRNAASQSSSNTQLLPIALGPAIAAPVNANVPVGLLSAGPRQGNVSQRADADAAAEALNNETEQSIRQDGRDGSRNTASQSAANTQLLPIALGAALGLPINANVPVALLSAGPLQGDVDQHADAGTRARAANNEHDQSVRQEGGEGGQNTASQSASNTQLLPISLGAALGIPINANVPISILSSGPVQGDVRQRADADAAAEALNNETEQSIRQDGRDGGQNVASQSAANTQILPIALGAALALPINLNVPIAILSNGPIQGAVSQQGHAGAAAEAINNELDQSVEQASGRDDGRNTASQTASNTQVLPVALGPAVALPLNVNLPISILSNGTVLGIGGLDLLTAIPAILANPFGATSAVVGNPVGAVTGLLSGL